ncbi:glutathione peroxidase [Thermoflavimicrobium dichotomicum]|uniref:Glutathione peroxidase n=1 Tax=Thermoflavimicrobium dichotomicum TaxID=46223 RepID=A0A1I3NMJ4_9BACL|nr:glutathione peroxidase [Thermoflavimicrobium dichotomicum]SFJ10435.1 glutathione peroxidase [Thermoflavimicrobium dichotomicum]
MTLYDIKVKTAQGSEKSLAEYKGYPLLIVNVASQCGYTPQYEGLEKLYQTYREKGLRILAFPCNDFGGQEPGTIEEIQQFCQVNYGVTFEVFDKIHVRESEIHPLYQWLTSQDGEGDVKWNFEKFLVSSQGKLIRRFRSGVNPLDPELVKAVETEL